MKKLFLLFCIFFSIQTSFAADVVVTSITTLTDIDAAIADSDVDTIHFTEDVTITGQITLPQETTITVDSGVVVDFQWDSSSQTDSGFKSSKKITIHNEGTLNFVDYHRPISSTNACEVYGGKIDIQNNSGYAMFCKNATIKNAEIITNTTDTNKESALFFGFQPGDTVLVENSTFHLVNNSDEPSSAAFQSNAGTVTFTNTDIFSSSRAHYNFNVYSNPKTEGDEQKVTFDNSTLNLDTPSDSNPHRTMYLTFKMNAVGINSANTIFTVKNGSEITHDIHDFTGNVDSIELDGADFIVENSTVDFVSVGLDYNTSDARGEEAANSFSITGCESTVTIDIFHEVFYPSYPGNGTYLEIANTKLNEIIYISGTLTIPTDGKPVKDENGEIIEKTSSADEKDTFEIRCVWAFSEDHFYYDTQEHLDTKTCTAPNCIAEEGEISFKKPEETFETELKNKELYELVSVIKEVYDIQNSASEADDVLESTEEIYTIDSGYSKPEKKSENYEKWKKIVYVYNYLPQGSFKEIHKYYETQENFKNNEAPVEEIASDIKLQVWGIETETQLTGKDAYDLVSVTKEVYSMSGTLDENDDIQEENETETIEITEANKAEFENGKTIEYKNGKKIVYTYNYVKQDLGLFEDSHNYFFNIQAYNAGNCDTGNCTHEDGKTGTGKTAETTSTDDQEENKYKLASVTKMLYSMNDTLAVDDDILESKTEVYNYESGDTFPETTVAYENGKRIAYIYNYIKTGTLTIKYFEETTDGVLEKEEIVTGFVGEEYHATDLIKSIWWYTFTSVRDGDEEVGNFVDTETEVVYYYNKVEIKISWSAPCNDESCFEVEEDTNVSVVEEESDEYIEEEIQEEVVEEEIIEEVEQTLIENLPNDFEPVAPMHLEEEKVFEFEPVAPIHLEDTNSDIKNYPKILPQTGASMKHTHTGGRNIFSRILQLLQHIFM